MNVIIGATRQRGPGNAHATVGDHLVIVVNDEDLNPELPPWLTGMLVRSVDFQRQVILNRGFTVQFACDFDMSLSFPETSASGVTASTATATIPTAAVPAATTRTTSPDPAAPSGTTTGTETTTTSGIETTTTTGTSTSTNTNTSVSIST